MALLSWPAVTPRLAMLMLALAVPQLTAGLTNGGQGVWHVVWVGGQSNAVGTNSQKSGYPTWPKTSRVKMFCWSERLRCVEGTFADAEYPVYGEHNVGFSLTYANLLLRTLPASDGVVLVNTGVGGSGFSHHQWNVPTGPLLQQSVAAMNKLAMAIPTNLSGGYNFHSMLWHQGEEDAGDNREGFHASYCQYLVNDLTALVDYLRNTFKGAGDGTPFVDGGLLPYWANKYNGTGGVTSAIYALNTTRPCTATADSRIFPDYIVQQNGTRIPNGDCCCKSGVSHDVIHFNATEATLMGYQYFEAYHRALALNHAVPSARTKACPRVTPEPRTITHCAGAAGYSSHGKR